MRFTQQQRQAAHLAYWIYMQSPGDDQVFDYIHERDGATVGFKLVDSVLYIAFQGTQAGKTFDFRDIVADIRFGHGITAWGRVRLGFFEHTSKVTAAVRNRIDNMRPESVVLCGHSLGGAMATIALALIWQDYRGLRDSIELHTFGSPRCARRGFAARVKYELNGRCSRFVYGRDRVPSVPTFLAGWYHLHGRVYISRGGEIIQREGWSMWKNKLIGLVMFPLVPWWVRDHAMGNYLAAVGDDVTTTK